MKRSVIVVVLLIIVSVIAFFGGIKYQQSKTGRFSRQFSNSQFGQQGTNRQGSFASTRPITGEIIAKDDKSITVKTQDNTSKIVLYSNTTQVVNSQQASTADLKTGERVAIFGNANSDGSFTAGNIQLNPAFQPRQN